MKFIVDKFFDFKMTDAKTIISQIQELQLIIHKIHDEGMTLSESFQVVSAIEKLPPSWKNFMNYLKHKLKEMQMEDLVVCLRIGEDNHKLEKKKNNMEAKVNMVKHDKSTNKRKRQDEPTKKNKEIWQKMFQL